MQHHMNKDVNAAMVALSDELCMFERDCGRRSTLVLIPHEQDEKMVLIRDGKPVNDPKTVDILQALADAFGGRHGGEEMRRLLHNVIDQIY